jgi:histone H3/H4
MNIYITELARKFNINLKDKTAEKCLCDCVENIVFNLISIASLIAFINNSKMVTDKTIQILNKYVIEKCGKVKGGGGSIVLPSEFYGVDSNRYSASNAGSDVLTIDFNNGILRPQIGGGTSKNNYINDSIREILDRNKLKASASIIKKLRIFIEHYLHCLLKKLSDSKTKVSATTIKRTLHSNKLFNIFK